jgi:zinc protease
MPTVHSAAADLSLTQNLWANDTFRTVLPNGLTLLINPDHRTALASVQVWVKTGSIHEDGHLGAGLSHYLEHMLFKGTARRSGREISASVHACGGHMNAYTTFDRTVYYIDIPAEHTEMALDILGDMVLHSTLPADEVKKEKDVILREIAMGQDEPDQRLGEALFATAFRVHPYAHPIIGYLDVFTAITRKELMSYYRARYVPNNMVVVVVGAVDVAAVQKAVGRFFAGSRVGLAPVLVPDEPVQLGPRELHRFEKVELSRAGLAWHIPGLTHADAPALDVLAMILGAGDSSVLWQRMRERTGLVHSIDATSWNPGTTGLFYISYICDGDKREAAKAAIFGELQRLVRSGFPQTELRKAVRQLIVAEINSRKTVSGLASRLGMAEVVVGDLNFSQTYFQRLTALGPRDIQRVLKLYLQDINCSSVSLNPEISRSPACATGAAVSTLEDFQLIEISNGARLVLQSDKSLPKVHLRLCALGGPRYEPPQRRGATALLATLLTKDTKRSTAVAVARKVEEVGGSFSSFSGNNSFGLALEVLPPDFERALEVLSEAVLQPAFRPGTLAIERDAQLAGLKEDRDNVVSFGGKVLRQKFFGAHPFAIDASGDESGVAAITPRDLVRLHRQLLCAGNVVLVVTGDFEPGAVVESCRKFLERLKSGKLMPGGAVEKLPAETGSFIEKQPRQQAVLFEAYPGPALLSPDFYVSEVMDELFSGMSSRLFARVRDDLGLAYYVRSSRLIGLDAAMFYFYAGTAPDSEKAVFREIAAEISRVVRGGVTKTELKRCQVRLKAAHRMGMQTNSSRAMQASLNVLYGLPVNDWKKYGERIDAIKTTDLARFARTYFARTQRIRLTVRP